MIAAEHSSFVQKLLAQPYDPRALFDAHAELGSDPTAYASLLAEAALRTEEHAAASHWLTEAARVQKEALQDPHGAARLLDAALDRDPLNLRAAEHLVELCRSHRADAELVALLRGRAARLHERYLAEPTDAPRAAAAFETLSAVYESLGDQAAALGALRTALALERTRHRTTLRSPPPDGPPESSFRSLGAVMARPPQSGVGGSIPPEPPRRDTVPSPIPLAPVKESERVPTAEAPLQTQRPEAGAASFRPDPLLQVIEALHELRHAAGVVEGAALVLRTLLDAIPVEAGLVHVADVAARDLVVVAASGDRSTEIIGSRTAEGDPIVARALAAAETIQVDGEAVGSFAGSRWLVLPPVGAVLCAPVQYDGRHLGVIELIAGEEDDPFSDADRHAMTYVGERFAEFLGDRGVTF